MDSHRRENKALDGAGFDSTFPQVTSVRKTHRGLRENLASPSVSFPRSQPMKVAHGLGCRMRETRHLRFGGRGDRHQPISPAPIIVRRSTIL